MHLTCASVKGEDMLSSKEAMSCSQYLKWKTGAMRRQEEREDMTIGRA